MVNANRLYLVPQILTDIVQSLFSETRNHAQQNYKLRLEVIRDYCNEELEHYKTFKTKQNEERRDRYSND